MTYDLTITALLTGRGGSALVNKNILRVLNKPLLAYPAEAAKRSRYITSFYVTSDDTRILKTAGAIGYKKIQRPKHLSTAGSQHSDVIMHAIRKIREETRLIPDILVILLANSASIKTGWIDACIEEVLKDKNISAVVPVCEDLDHHPFRAKRTDRNGFLTSFFNFMGKKISTNRQDLEPSYFLCHNFWVLNTKKSIFSRGGQPPWTFMGNRVKPFVVKDCCDIHARSDLKKTEEWILKNKLSI